MSRLGAEHVRVARYVWAIGRTCPVKIASAVPETSETAQKIDIQWILVYVQYNIYMCGTWTSFEKQYIYIYIWLETI
jgi:hypothetical protein